MTKVIHLRDNDYTGQVLTESKKVLEDLRQIAAIDFHKLPENLLAFPQSFSDIKDGSIKKDGAEKLPILSLVETYSKTAEGKEEKSIKAVTGNIMGFVGKGDTSVSIHSRFTSDGKGKFGEDYFLYLMLQRVFNINMVNLDHTVDSKDKTLDFLLFMFPNALKEALAQGLYKQYQSRDFDDSRVRGTISVNQVMRNDIPFRGRVSYRTRVHTYDNTVTQLVRHTIEYMKSHPFGSAILSNDPDTKEAVDRITMATPSYTHRDREKILKANLRPKIHPYFLKYKDLQKLCVRILRHDSLKYGQDKEKVHGVIFDGAWLWEEYLNTILKGLGFEHPRNKDKEGAVYMFRKNVKKAASEVDDIVYPEEFHYYGQKMYPDFYKPSAKEEKSGKSADMILDAKYKHLNGKAGREDLFQVISYMHCMEAPVGGYIYPDRASKEPPEEPSVKSYLLNGFGGILSAIPFEVPDSANWKDFLDAIKGSEENLKATIKQVENNLQTVSRKNFRLDF